MTDRANQKAKRPYLLAEVDPGTEVASGDDVLPYDHVAPARDCGSVFVDVCVECDYDAVLSKVYDDGSAENVALLNKGEALVDGAEYVLASIEMKDRPFNFRFNQDVRIVKFLVTAKDD